MNYNHSNMMQHFHQIYGHLNTQHERVSQLEETIHQLQNEINRLKEKQTSNIEKIEYKFDQLKVEKLEGTLNIGITPNNGGESSVEDFSVNQHDLNIPRNQQQESAFFEEIQEQIHEYLNEECYRDIRFIENQNNYQIDNHYRQYIMEDIRKQVDNRVRYYLSQLDLNNLKQEELVKMKEMAIRKIKEDVHKTYEEFLKQLPRKENES
ncbi:spore germination protein GerPC [Salipaludibacillus daqingensis]|uniref:spore germination protein GerPC n=1 Tax=Salipaludibacillus daqingensis TaxID=3041001 RepID=UPI0024730853|nr:spore germination protein GerPC [Salipaludibacillus daqingensis]